MLNLWKSISCRFDIFQSCVDSFLGHCDSEEVWSYYYENWNVDEKFRLFTFSGYEYGCVRPDMIKVPDRFWSQMIESVLVEDNHDEKMNCTDQEIYGLLDSCLEISPDIPFAQAQILGEEGKEEEKEKEKEDELETQKTMDNQNVSLTTIAPLTTKKFVTTSPTLKKIPQNVNDCRFKIFQNCVQILINPKCHNITSRYRLWNRYDDDNNSENSIRKFEKFSDEDKRCEVNVRQKQTEERKARMRNFDNYKTTGWPSSGRVNEICIIWLFLFLLY